MEHVEIEEEKRSPLWVIAALIGIFILLLSMIPFYGIPENPEPRNIPTLQDLPKVTSNKSYFDNPTHENYPSFVQVDPQIKRTADIIVSQSCKGTKVCYAKALYYFVRDELQYVNDPTAFEYVKTPHEALTSQGGAEENQILKRLTRRRRRLVNERVRVLNAHHRPTFGPSARGFWRSPGRPATSGSCASWPAAPD